MRLEDLMLSKGYTQQELSDLGPMLNNAKFRATLEAELDNAVKASHDLDEYDRWFTNEITPQHEQLMKRVADAEAEAAASKARFEAYQNSGMRKQAGGGGQLSEDARKAEEEAARAREAAKGAGVDTSKFVTTDVFSQAYEKTGEAIAQAINITTQHMQMFPGQYLDMEKLREEARIAKKPVKDYWENKYGVSARRAELVEKERQDHENRIRADERQKMAVEFGGSNPNLQVGMGSNNPFVIKKRTAETKQPWEQTPNDVSRARVLKAVEKAAGRGELVS